MTVKCTLYSRHSAAPLTSTLVTPRHSIFMAATDNPFPASELMSAIVYENDMEILYRVRDLSALEAQADREEA